MIFARLSHEERTRIPVRAKAGTAAFRHFGSTETSMAGMGVSTN